MLKHELQEIQKLSSPDLYLAPLTPRYLRPTAAAHYVSCSRATFYRLLTAGAFRSVLVADPLGKARGRIRLIDRESVDEFFARLPDAPLRDPPQLAEARRARLALARSKIKRTSKGARKGKEPPAVKEVK
jgi:helix-turn-helix protein